LKGELKVVDASHIIADIAIPNTINLLRQGRRVIIREIEKVVSEEEKREEGDGERVDVLREECWEAVSKTKGRGT